MVHVASELERRNINLPLLIGGATTSEIHAAVKVAPAYSNTVIHVKDASKAAGVLSSLLQKDNVAYITEVRNKYKRMREDHSSRQTEKSLISISDARKNGYHTDWQTYKIFDPVKPGHHVLDSVDLNELTEYIDWTFFFFSWKLSGKYPAIFNDPLKGEEAKKLFADAQKFLRIAIDQKILEAKAVFGIYPAVSEGDDIKVFSDKRGKELLTIFRFLRNQEKKEKGVPNLSLSDYIAPETSGLIDNIGTFVVTVPIDNEKLNKFKEDDYATIMIRILSDRFAEAAAEWLHEKIRTDYWGYAPQEKLPIEDLLKLKYKGIRPAPGYPACPDHTEKRVLFDLLSAEKHIGAELTENYAMVPPASVSGFFFSHPGSSYFNIGKINSDQLKDYAFRKNMTIEEASKWLAPNL